MIYKRDQPLLKSSQDQPAAYVVARCAVAVRSIRSHVYVRATLCTLRIGHDVDASKQSAV